MVKKINHKSLVKYFAFIKCCRVLYGVAVVVFAMLKTFTPARILMSSFRVFGLNSKKKKNVLNRNMATTGNHRIYSLPI